MKIAFLDSGIGGLTVLHEALQLMPNEQYIYFADSKNAPYGTKSPAAIRALVFQAVDFLAQFELKALVLACNTATSVAVKELRKAYDFPIIGMEPAVKPAVDANNNKKILVCATDRTLAANKLKTLIQNLNATDQVEQLSLQKLVLFAEEFNFQSPAINDYLSTSFENIQWQEFDSIVLGCTHFPYFKNQIQALVPPHIRIWDGNYGTAKHLQSRIAPSTATSSSPVQYFISKEATPASYFHKYFSLINRQHHSL